MNGSTTIGLTLVLAAVGLKVTDFVKYLVALGSAATARRTDGLNGILTLFMTSVISFIIVQFALKGPSWGSEILVGNTPVDQLSIGQTILFSIGFTTVASTLYDFKKAIDASDSAKKPKLLEGASSQPDEG